MIDTRHEFGGLFSIYQWLTVGVTAIVFGIVPFALVRYRRRRGGSPNGRAEAKVGESVYAVVLAVIAAGLVAATFHTESRVDPLAASPKLRIRITAFEWQWRFDYPNGRSVVGKPGHPPVLVVPAHREIEFEETSRDVIHSCSTPGTADERGRRGPRGRVLDWVGSTDHKRIGLRVATSGSRCRTPFRVKGPLCQDCNICTSGSRCPDAGIGTPEAPLSRGSRLGVTLLLR